MAAGYVDIARGTVGEPDDRVVLASLRTALADATIGMYRATGGTIYRLKKNSDWTAAQARLAQTTIDGVPIATAQTVAQLAIDDLPIATKALVLTLLDEINALRTALALVPRSPGQLLTAARLKAGQIS